MPPLTDAELAILRAIIAPVTTMATATSADPAVLAGKLAGISVAFDATIITAAVAAGIDPIAFSATYGAGGCALVTERTLQAQADALRVNSRTASAAAEAAAQALEAKAATIQTALQTTAAATGSGS